jgi:hypothetical protein
MPDCATSRNLERGFDSRTRCHSTIVISRNFITESQKKQQQRRVETVGEFKLSIVSVIRSKARGNPLTSNEPAAGPIAKSELMHVYEVRPRKDKSGADLVSDVLPFGRLVYGGPNATSNAVDYAKFF